MTIDEAIEHAKRVAASCDGECADNHRQLAEWLKELKQWQKLVEGIDLRPESMMKPFQPNVNDLERENDRLRAENEKLREMAAQALQTIKHVNVVMAIDYARYSALMSMARELRIEA